MRATAKGQKIDQVELFRSAADSWKRIQRAAERNLLTVGLTIPEFRILRVLRDVGSSPMNRFSTETLLSQPTITGIVDKLVQAGLVERVRSLQDRREVIIGLTPKGGDALAKGEDAHRQFVKRSLSVLTEGEMDLLDSVLKRLADESDPPDPPSE
ncbi:MAG TPA: MarR family winged helix-turn-helix transcriptional regulator [Nitrososphaerales archaeon]|nr:MarR family winged helix-turn-helix transcriptional regulator [Nitrososphaerales archaeon]